MQISDIIKNMNMVVNISIKDVIDTECRTDFFVQSPILSIVTTQWCFIVARLLGRMSADTDS